MSSGSAVRRATGQVRLGVVREVITCLRGLLDGLDPACLSPGQAVRLVEELAEVERLAAAGKTLAAGRAASTGAWSDGTVRDFETWLARVSGTTVGAAKATVATATRLRELPTTEAALRSGALSARQAEAVVDAAVKDPQAERSLLESAAVNGMKGLRDDCERVKAAARSREEEQARYARAVRDRSLRHYQDTDGLGRIDIRGPIDQTARIMARLEPFERSRFDAARKAGKHERPEAYAFDALVDLTDAATTRAGANAVSDADETGTGGTTTSSGPRVELVVHVDHAALVRGHTESGETCEIAGVGPIPVSVAERLACDAYLKVLVEDATDILAVAHPGRNIPARLKTALEARDRECVIAGCHATAHLEIDHNVPVSEGGETSIHNCHRLCPFHHDHKHEYDARLVGTPGQMTFAYPDGRAPPTPAPP